MTDLIIVIISNPDMGGDISEKGPTPRDMRCSLRTDNSTQAVCLDAASLAVQALTGSLKPLTALPSLDVSNPLEG